MRKSIGLEELEVAPVVIAEADPMDNMEAAVAGQDAEVEAHADQLAEASGIRSAIASTVVLVRNGADASALVPVLEHLQSRLGYKVKILSLEEIGEQTSAADQLEAFLPNLDASLSVAEEGFGNRILSSLEHFFRTYNGIERSMHDAVAKLTAVGSREEHFEADFSASEIYRRIGKTEITGADVLKLMKDLDKLHARFVPFAKRAVAQLHNVTRLLESNIYVAGKNSGDKIRASLGDIVKIDEETSDLIGEVNATGREKKANMMLEPVDAATAAKLADFTSMIKNMKQANDLCDEINDAYLMMTTAMRRAMKTRLMGVFAEDVRAVFSATSFMKKRMFNAVWDLATIEKRIVFANYRYIKASIAR